MSGATVTFTVAAAGNGAVAVRQRHGHDHSRHKRQRRGDGVRIYGKYDCGRTIHGDGDVRYCNISGVHPDE